MTTLGNYDFLSEHFLDLSYIKLTRRWLLVACYKNKIFIYFIWLFFFWQVDIMTLQVDIIIWQIMTEICHNRISFSLQRELKVVQNSKPCSFMDWIIENYSENTWTIFNFSNSSQESNDQFQLTWHESSFKGMNACF